MSKHKKKHKDWNNGSRKNLQSEGGHPDEKSQKGELVDGVVLSDVIKEVETEIDSVGLTTEDMLALKARLDAANAKLASVEKSAESELQAKAYAKLRIEAETKVKEYETLSDADLSTQELVDSASSAKIKVSFDGLSDEDVISFKMRIDEADRKILEVQKSIDSATAYAMKKAEMEKKIAEIELLANVKSLTTAMENDAEKDLEEYEAENKKSENLIVPTLKFDKNKIFVAIFLLLVVGSYGFSYLKKASANNDVALKDKTEKYIKDNLVQPGTDIKITDFAKEGNLYKFTVAVGSQKVVSYLTGDGKKLLLNPIDLDGSSDTPASAPAASASQASAAPAPVTQVSQKKNVPDVELFVMSQCPYGVQAEKGILPVIQKIGSKVNFSVKYVDYTLHGKKEFDENLNQYCIQKEEPAKFNDYLTCYVKGGDSATCATTAKIDSAKNTACISSTDKQFKLTENFVASGSSPFNVQKDLNDKYGVQGSPSLVINGQLVDSGRDSASYLKTICSGFSNQPEECKAALSSTSPSPGFGN